MEAGLLVVLWTVGFPGYHAGPIIHGLLVIAFITLSLRIIQGNKPA